MLKNNERNAGITLVALVITIIILLILAGITINQLTGDNGLFARAKEAKQNTIEAQEKENAILDEYEKYIENETTEEEAYAMLYSDGTMVFQRGNVEDSSYGTLIASYTGFEKEEYGPVIENDWNGEINTPWYENKNNVKSIIFKDMIKPISVQYWFQNLSNCTNIDITNLNTSKCTSFGHMFFSCSSIRTIDVSKFDTRNIKGCQAMFTDCKSLISINGLSNWNTSNVTSFNNMFQGCVSLETIDLTSFDTSKGIDFFMMLYGCTSIKSLDISNFDTSQAKRMTNIFGAMTALQEISLGEKFNFIGSSESSNLAKLPDGNWQAKSDGTIYAAIDVPSNKADVYVKNL